MSDVPGDARGIDVYVDEAFARSLAEAMAWARVRTALGAASSFRSAALRPAVEAFARAGGDDVDLAHLRDTDAMRAVVQDVVRRRHDAITGVAADVLSAVRGDDPWAVLAREPRGFVVAFGPDDTLGDGAAKDGSAGYFDDVNAPPWDLWIDLVLARGRRLLLAWVPESHRELALAGIRVNPEDCIFAVELPRLP